MDTTNSSPALQGGLHYCDICRQPGNVRYLLLTQRTGMLVSRETRTFRGNMCQDCAARLHKKVQIHNLFLAWWGTISFCLAPFTLIANTARYVQFRRSL
ncbi:MAG: hypothetical protein JWO47_577 [Candidatus Saccharibacteria bacterium]|nr:hypothetical protein [Candidatus Saccharibacteria bacterium]